MAARMLKKDGEGELEQAFGLFDDGSGKVSVETIRTMLTEMGSHALPREEVDTLLSMLTVDADKRVSMDEFRRLPCWEVPLPDSPRNAAAEEQRKRRAEAKA